MIELDEVDRRILEILQQDARIANAELARRVGLTPTPTLERVKRLEREGVVRRYAALVDPAALGLGLTVLASVTLAMHDAAAVDAFLDAVRDIPQVLECHHLTGEADFLLKIVVEDTRAYEAFLRGALTQLPGVRRIRTSVVLSTPKDETAIPLRRP